MTSATTWLDRLQVRAVCGHLLDVEADAIAVPIFAGRLSELLAAPLAFTQALAEQCAEHPQLGVGDALVLDGGELGLPHVEDVVVVGFDESDVPRAVGSVLRSAFVLDAKRLAMPVLGAPEELVELIRSFAAQKASRMYSVEVLTFVSTDQDDVKRLAQVLRASGLCGASTT